MIVDMAHMRRALELYRLEFYRRLLPDGSMSAGAIHALLYVFLVGFRLDAAHAASVGCELTQSLGLTGETAQDFQKGFRLTVERLVDCYRRTA